MGKDYYNILGIDKGSNQDDIKRAFRKKAHEFHPDKKDGNEQKFKEINEAYQVLNDSKKRSQYDQFGSTFEQAKQQGGFSGFEGFRDFSGFANGFSGQGGARVDMDDLGDIFGGLGDIFGFSSSRSGGRVSADIRVELEISFAEAVFGAEKKISLNKRVVCPHCHGNRAEPGTKISTCQTCKGSGRVSRVQRTILGNMQTQSVCGDCQGKGKMFAQKCSKCGGEALINDKVDLKVKIPAGIDSGETIRINGQGQAVADGQRNGDLYIQIKVSLDKRWERDAYDIRTTQDIGFTQAAIGDKIPIETIHGQLNLKIPAGTESGTIFKLRGKGISKLRGSGKGDHFVKIIVKTPKNLSRKQKKLLLELGL